jgi:hypothetical protein
MFETPSSCQEYPIVRFPYKLLNAAEANIPIDYQIVEPIIPQSRKIDFNKLTLWLIVIVALAILSDADIQFKIIFALGLSLFLCLLFAIIENHNIEIENKLNLSNYREELYKYNIQKKYLDHLKEEIRNEKDTLAYRKEKIFELLQTTIKPDLIYNSKKGKTEEFFYKFLTVYFPGKIFTNCAILPYPNSLPFQPDFTFQDLETNLHIDIEIDEPYVLHSSEHEAIHYLEDETHIDEMRDSRFCQRNWIVIRFAEIQIVLYPELCCDFIQQVIDSVIKKNDFHINKFMFKESGMCRKIPFWTRADSYEMAVKLYREQYLKNLITLKQEIAIDNYHLVKLEPKIINDDDDLPF